MSQSHTPPSGKVLAGLSLAALGVVYGDIGTSPLYAIKECFAGTHGVLPTEENVLGVLSMVFWALNFVVSFKYIGMVMRADNRGEGGILALLALATSGGKMVGRGVLLMVGLFGAALLYGDGVITPAISVLGGLEGLDVATPIFRPFVVPLALVIISALFFLQRRGTAGVGKIFGPVTTLWFVCIALLGIRGIVLEPSVLRALNPWHAVLYFQNNGLAGMEVLAAVVLVITGGEALYADMGHFGPKPIRLAWYGVVLPALMLNYMGQGALLLHDATAVTNPFFRLAPTWALIPMVVIGTSAAIVASQALISGAYSLTQQAMQLGFAPRMRLLHTSRTHIGQIYMPGINAALWVTCVGLVIGFKTSSNLAATYGVAVTGTMLTTSILFAVVVRKLWHWPIWKAAIVTVLFVTVDLAFLGANMLKIQHGGWLPDRAGRHRLPADEHLEARPDPGHRPPQGDVASARSLRARYREAQASAGAGGGGVHDVDSRCCLAGAAASPQAQQGAAREGDPDDGGVAGNSDDPRGRADHRGVEGRGVLSGGGPLRLHGDAQRAGGALGDRQPAVGAGRAAATNARDARGLVLPRA